MIVLCIALIEGKLAAYIYIWHFKRVVADFLDPPLGDPATYKSWRHDWKARKVLVCFFQYTTMIYHFILAESK